LRNNKTHYHSNTKTSCFRFHYANTVTYNLKLMPMPPSKLITEQEHANSLYRSAVTLLQSLLVEANINTLTVSRNQYN